MFFIINYVYVIFSEETGLEIRFGEEYLEYAPIEAIAMTPEEWDSESSAVCYYAKDGEVV